ncbi:MAG: HAD family phosphatase [Collinsella sp.]|nr:HAD family phosphatase [Collinsella sp.]
MLRAVLFDNDGVLVDTEWFYNRRRVAYLRTQGFVFDEIPDLSGSDEVSVWEHFVPDDPVRRRQLKEGYASYMEEHPVPYDELLNRDAGPVMAELRSRGVMCAIASSGRLEMIQQMVDAAQIEDMLDLKLSAHDCGAFKPDPDVYLRAMELLGVSPDECLVIEDSPLGIEAGVRSGARTLALRPKEGVSLDQSGAHRVIDNLWDILDELA